MSETTRPRTSASTANANSMPSSSPSQRQLAALQPLLQGLRPGGQLDEPHHVVDDQLADVEGRDRQQRPHQP